MARAESPGFPGLPNRLFVSLLVSCPLSLVGHFPLRQPWPIKDTVVRIPTGSICCASIITAIVLLESTFLTADVAKGVPAGKGRIPHGQEVEMTVLSKGEMAQWALGAVHIRNGSLDSFSELLLANPRLAKRPVDVVSRNTLLHEACRHNACDAIRMLLEYGASTNSRTGVSQETPLHVAAKSDSVEAVLLLLDEGVDFNLAGAGPTPDGNPHVVVPFASPLDVAAAAGAERVVQLLLDRDAKTDINPDRSRYCALHRAMEGRYDDLGYGNLKRLEEKTLRASPGNRKVIELLLKHGCKLSDADHLGNTPFHVAVRYGAIETLEYLFEKHASDVDAKQLGQFGYTPLQLAVSEFHGRDEETTESVIQLLLEHGADIQRAAGPSRPKLTAYDVAAKSGWGEKILSLLRVKEPGDM